MNPKRCAYNIVSNVDMHFIVECNAPTFWPDDPDLVGVLDGLALDGVCATASCTSPYLLGAVLPSPRPSCTEERVLKHAVLDTYSKIENIIEPGPK